MRDNVVWVLVYVWMEFEAGSVLGFWLHHVWQAQSCRDRLLLVVLWCEGGFGQVSCGVVALRSF